MAGLGGYVPTPLKPLAKKVRSAIRLIEKAPLDSPLSAIDSRAQIRLGTPSIVVEKSTEVPCPVRVTNHGHSVWSSAGQCPLFQSFKWLTARKVPLDVPVQKVPLASAVYPGETVDLQPMLAVPDALGHYLVKVGFAQDGGPEFGDVSGKTLYLEVQITGKAADDIDYHKAYATADLAQDYWTVVGPGTKDEFYKLGQSKLQTLLENGLTPDSRVLDVGCGTGQLAVPLESYLSGKGFFYGTDIGIEAIPYCEARFKRPNFKFVQNEMTVIPIQDTTFDFVTFFSVFTHTFPDETALLLAEAKRLLAPKGCIIGDIFTSPMVERCSGNRGAMELNPEHFHRLVKLAGLQTHLLAEWPWQKYGKRQVFRFAHPTGERG